MFASKRQTGGTLQTSNSMAEAEVTEFAITTNTALLTSHMQNNSPDNADDLLGNSARISLTPPKRGKHVNEFCEQVTFQRRASAEH
jgi:hypothetical protein